MNYHGKYTSGINQLLLIAFTMIFNFTPVGLGGGLEYLDLSTFQSKIALERMGDVTHWATDDWALVVPGKMSDALPFFDDKADSGFYLFFTSEPMDSLFQQQGIVDAVEMKAGLYVLQTDSTYVANPGHGSHLINITVPSHYRDSAAIDIPSEVEYNQMIDDLIQNVSESVMMTHLETLVAFVTRYSYAQGCYDASVWLQDQFENLGYWVSTADHTTGMAPNVIAELTGTTHPEEIVIVCGHYDSTSGQPTVLAPGADDNGTGTCVTLETARILAETSFEKTIRFICFSGEEQGLNGSQSYATNAYQNGEQIIGVLNFDMVGWVEPYPEDLDCIGNNNSIPLVDFVEECADVYETVSTQKHIDGTMQYSDHAPFWNKGYQAICGIEDEPINYPYYHKVTDTLDKVNSEFLGQVARTSVACTAHLAGAIRNEVFISKHEIDDSSGDSDGYLDPNETVRIIVYVKNNLDISSGDITATISCTEGSEYVEIMDATSSFSGIDPGQTASNLEDPFEILIKQGFSEFSIFEFEVQIDCTAPHMNLYKFTCEATSYSYNSAIYQWNMDQNPGWMVSGDMWEWGQPTGEGGTEHGYSDPASGFTGTNVLGTILTGDYPADSEGSVQSPQFNCEDIHHAELRFKRWLNIEQPRYDKASIWINDGAGFQKIWENTVEIIDSNWQEIAMDISTLVDGKSSVQVQFSLTSDHGWQYSGWNLDDIRIAGMTEGSALPSPTPNPNPTPTPVPNLYQTGVKLKLNQSDFTAGDPFQLTIDYWNSSPAFQPVVLFIILDVNGYYWFWPGWTPLMDYHALDMEPAAVVIDYPIFDFTWPQTSGSANGLIFWSAMTDLNFSHLKSNYDMVVWSFH